MNQDESRGLLKSILGIFARNSPEKPARPASVRSQAIDAWLRTDAYLQHDTDEFDQIDPKHLESTLSAFEDLVQHDPDPGPDSVSALDPRQLPVSRPFIFCILTQGREAEPTSQCALSEAPDGPQHEPAAES